jgi:hypothetical protein
MTPRLCKLASWSLIAFALLAAGCAPRGRFPSRKAKTPASRKELASVGVTVVPSASTPSGSSAQVQALLAPVAEALSARGFTVSPLPARHLALEAWVGLEAPEADSGAAPGSTLLVLELHTDGFWVDWASSLVTPELLQDPERVKAVLSALVDTLAESQRVAEYFSNGGVPAQALSGN